MPYAPQAVPGAEVRRAPFGNGKIAIERVATKWWSREAHAINRAHLL
jgi:hypothetical protein